MILSDIIICLIPIILCASFGLWASSVIREIKEREHLLEELRSMK